MTHDQAQLLISEFVSDSEMQSMVAEALNYCAALSTAVALTHGFHEDEKEVRQQLAAAPSPNKLGWFEVQLLQAEFARIVSECGEAVEGIRKPGPDSHCPQFSGWHVEAIDILVRVFDTLGKRDVQPGEIFVAKVLFNNTRPHKHNKNS